MPLGLTAVVATVLMALVVALALAPAPPVSAASADGFLQRLSGFGQTELVFAVAGDPQGREEVWSQVVKALNSVSPAPKFTLLLGDLVASGTEPQYTAFADSAKALKMPFYAVPGNHDIRGDGAALFRRYVSDKLYYSFEEGGYKFIGLNTGDGQVDAEQMQWLQKELAGEGRKIVFMHIPLEDPRPGGDHALLGRAQADELHAMFASSNVVAVFSGHVHMFAQHEADGVLYVTSGGAGAALYASPEEGGMFHFALVRVRDDEITVEPQPVQTQVTDPSVEVSGPSGTIKYSLGQLMQMSSVEGASAFENRFGNFTGHGVYLGVPVADLVAAVGGIQPGDVLRVQSSDGYEQDYAYDNVHPTPQWAELQGIMVLAVEKDGITMPAWGDGPRIVFIPPDGLYHNTDCAATSAPGQGWNVYQSAGARWARYVSRIQVVPSGN